MIAASKITMRFGQRTLFENVSVKFNPGHIYGLIGANGAGKSTFMKIMTGELDASSGDIILAPDATMSYLRQDHYAFDDQLILDVVLMGNKNLWRIHQRREELYSKTDLTESETDEIGDIEEEFDKAGGYTMEADAAKMLQGLGISEDQHFETMSSLTGGFKFRVLLAQCLFADPDVLLMDEPTNNLDMASIDWLINFLKRTQATVVVISHDRHFLNSVCTDIADLDYGEVRMFVGNYDDFIIANDIAMDQIRKDNAKKEKRVEELQGFIQRFGANASKAKQATARRKELEKIDIQKFKPSSRVSPFIRFESLEKLGEKVFDLDNVSKTYDDADGQVFSPVKLTIGKGEKIGVIGTNGVGKTTLLQMIIGALQPSEGAVDQGETVKVGYFPQDNSDMLNGDIQAIEWLSQFNPEEGNNETELRSFMGKMLFSGNDVFKPVNVLSGGERARLVLSRMMMEGGNVLVLDEPTNHLDLESIEALNVGLSKVEDTIIFVSHDREFVNSLSTRILAFEDDKLIDYPGNLEEFEAWKKEQKRQEKKKKK